ncbi:MAG: MFS transporter [Candidatus Bilamarchaeaceae archaeon]
MLRKIGALNFIEQFKYGALTLALPLYLLSRGVNIGEIGLVFSLLPLAFVLIRVVASVFADVVGVKILFMTSMAFEALASLIYSYATAPIHFAIGKLAEGSDEACFWAVDRTAIIARAHEIKYLSIMGTVREFGGAIGILAAGFIITQFSFGFLFWSLIVMGVAGMLIAAAIANRGATLKHVEWGTLFRTGEQSSKEDEYWATAGHVADKAEFSTQNSFIWLHTPRRSE